MTLIGKYGLVHLEDAGTHTYRAVVPGTSLNATGYSAAVKVYVS